MEDTALFLFSIIGIFVFWRATAGLRLAPESTAYTERRSGYAAQTPFHAVSIHAEGQCCGAVKAVEAQRFLSEEAPGLPLPLCDQEACRCIYQHHRDRRSGARDRRYSQQLATDTARFWSLKNRRSKPGRRGGDFQVA